MVRASLRVNYDDGKQSTYTSFDVTYAVKGKEVVKSFATGDPIIDYLDYKLWVGYKAQQETIYSVGYSSSYDHFFFDGNRYKSINFEFTPDPNNAERLVARTVTSDEAVRMPRKQFDELHEYITRHPYNTWEKLLGYYRKKKGLGKNDPVWNDPDETSDKG